MAKAEAIGKDRPKTQKLWEEYAAYNQHNTRRNNGIIDIGNILNGMRPESGVNYTGRY